MDEDYNELIYNICKYNQYNYVSKKINNYEIESNFCKPFNMCQACHGLCGAVEGNNKKIAQMMLDIGAHPKNTNSLNVACKNGNIDIINLLISYSEYEKQYFEYGLEIACENGNLKVVDIMLKNGANDMSRCLVGACKGGNLAIVGLILNSMGSDSDVNNTLNSAFKIACESNNLELVKLINSKVTNRTNRYWENGFINACISGNKEIADFITMI